METIKSLSGRVVVIKDQDGVLNLDVDEKKLNHQSLAGGGKNTHDAIDSHLSSSLNPHGVRAEQTGAVSISLVNKPKGVAGLDKEGKIEDSVIPDSIARYKDISSHSASISNPHKVTPEQIGALSIGVLGVPDGVAVLDGKGRLFSRHLPNNILLDGDLDSHLVNLDNPHKVTASQTGAIPEYEKGRHNGVVPLNGYGKIEAGFLPDCVVGKDDFNSHLFNESNPHKLTAVGIGAIPMSSKGIPGGVAVLGEDGFISSFCIPKEFLKSSELKLHLDDKVNPHGVTAKIVGAIPISQKGIPNGIATLNKNGQISDSHIPDNLVPFDTFKFHSESFENPHRVTVDQIGAIPVNEKGNHNGVAPLDINCNIPSEFIPDTILRVDAFNKHSDDNSNPHKIFPEQIGAIPNTLVGCSNGVAGLDNTGLLFVNNIPESILRKDTFLLHVSNEDNPHKVLPEHVGNAIPCWNANKLCGTDVNIKSPEEGQILRWSHKDTSWVCDNESMIGEVNTCENIGKGGIGVFYKKSGDVLQFSSIRPASTKTSVVFNEDTGTLDIDIKPKHIHHDDLVGVGNRSHSAIDSHISSSDNPHHVNADQIGKDVAQWNCNRLLGRNISTAVPSDGQVLKWNAEKKIWVPGNEAAFTAESNTASNIGKSGVGLFKRKKDANLEFKKIDVLGNKLRVEDDERNSRIVLGLNEGTIVHDNLSGAGKKTHIEIDLHVGSMSNPHNVTPKQIGAEKPEWNANKINGIYVDVSDLKDGDILTYSAKDNKMIPVNLVDVVHKVIMEFKDE